MRKINRFENPILESMYKVKPRNNSLRNLILIGIGISSIPCGFGLMIGNSIENKINRVQQVIQSSTQEKDKSPYKKINLIIQDSIQKRDASAHRTFKPYFDQYFKERNIPKYSWNWVSILGKNAVFSDLMRKNGYDNQTLSVALKEYCKSKNQ
ncbi:MAG: hypothetical protein ABH811_00840 [archaeon]